MSAAGRWWVRAALQGAVSGVPRAPALADRARRARPARLSQEYVRGKWVHVLRHTRAAGRLESGLAGRHVLDLGTGWFPVVPLGLRLAGAGAVTTIDLVDHLDPPRLRLTLRRLVEMADAGVLHGLEDLDLLERVRALAEDDAGDLAPQRTLAALGVRTHLGDARDLTDVPGADGAAMFVSNNTLEHIPADVIRAMFVEFSRVAAPDAVMHHHIDLADHYAHGDPRINDFHFLRWSDRAWRLANNRLLYQNRLRASDHERLHEEAGWRVVARREARREHAELHEVRVHPQFARYAEDDLLVVRTGLTSVRR